MNLFIKSRLCSQSSDFQTADYILTDENSFYYKFENDLNQAKQKVEELFAFLKYEHVCDIIFAFLSIN